jgi:hypothetical protein
MTRAERFERLVRETYEDLSPADEEWLAETVYVMEFLDRLREEIRASALTERRTGGERVTPLVVEERLRAAHLTTLLRRFPGVEEA